MARQDALQGSLPLLVLKLLARRGPLHGYAIATRIEGMSDETLRVEEGLALSRAPSARRSRLDQGALEDDDTGRRARVYEITADGRNQLESEEARWKAITAAVGKILKHA